MDGALKTQGSCQGSNPGPPALAAGALTSSPRPPEHPPSSFKGDKQPLTQTDAQGVCRDT